jgi:hypothetical protein
MLDGGDNLGLSLAQVEAMQRANKALLTGDGAAVLAAAATVSRERKQALAKPDALMLPELIDKWAAESSQRPGPSICGGGLAPCSMPSMEKSL